MNGTARLRYYRERVLDYLDEFGLPLRRRSLLFYRRRLDDESPTSLAYGEGAIVQPVTVEEFRNLNWPGDPIITSEAAQWERSERRWPIVARRCDTMEGFCWLEEGVAEIRFFDLQCPLPMRTLYLSRVWVYPSSRDLGIGRTLLESASAYARQLRFEQLISACVPHNVQMRHLFPKIGWTYYQRSRYLRVGRAVCFSIQPVGSSPVHLYSALEAGEKLTGCVRHEAKLG
jgi:GNAT superfamily N-acetyltransferase